MQQLSPEGQQRINDIAQRYNVSTDAVTTLLQAVVNGNGTMAQFSHPELGGSGQWMQGGMTMVGDMFNNNLKYLVDNICAELSQLVLSEPNLMRPTSSQSQTQNGYTQSQGYGYSPSSGGSSSLFVPPAQGSGNWWGNDLGAPTATGSQNNIRYAYFAHNQRLALEINGQVSIYNTLDHQIGGFAQQQGYGASLLFTSQYGTVDTLSLPLISGPGTANYAVQQSRNAVDNSNLGSDVYHKLEKLADLQQKGIISQEEFSNKKAELLNQI